MASITRLLWVGLLSVGIAGATTAHAGTQLFNGSWTVKSFGNERTNGTGESAVYSAFGIPAGVQCNPNQPRCNFASTPTDGKGKFAPLGGGQAKALFCAPWANWGGKGATARPAKGATLTTGGKGKRPIPPLYRNPKFFSSLGAQNTTSCTATSTDGMGGKGLVQAGDPITGMFVAATTTGKLKGSFNFPPAAAGKGPGLRATGIVGEFGALYPYVYSYTYVTMRNATGVFGPAKGPGDFLIQQKQGQAVVAMINVKQGAAKFGGTMRMLGGLTTKVCYYRNGGCSLGENNWLYDYVGTSAQTKGGKVTKGYLALTTAVYFNSGLGQFSSIMVEGSRFPWTTGKVTLTAVGRGPHKTVHYSTGFDNRTKAGKGTIQLVTPVLTRWLHPGVNYETGGVGILRLEFVPEPHTWMMLAAGISLLGVGYRMRGQ